MAQPRSQPHTGLQAGDVIAAYRRWADIYDVAFGAISRPARRLAVEAVNAAPGARVLEVGVGTGLALPLYAAEKRITGIDLSAEMLAIARRRVAEQKLTNVEALEERDAEHTGLPAASFDVAVAMFVASVVPNPRELLTEMRRVVRPGGTLLFVNHFAAERGLRWWVEKAMAPASRHLGWHPDFAYEAIFSAADMRGATLHPAFPGGLFTLVRLSN